MKAQSNRWRFNPLAWVSLAILAAIFIWLNIHSHSHGHHSHENLALRLSITLPELVIWLIATASALRFKQYAYSIRNSPDGRGLNSIANSLIFLVLYVISLSMSDSFERLFIGRSWLLPSVAIGNHLPTALILISSVLLYVGSNQLISLHPVNALSKLHKAVSITLAVAFFAVFVWKLYEMAPDLPANDGVPRFALAPGILVFSYGLTHVLAWALGIIACVNLGRYSVSVKGAIYKPLFKNLYIGLVLVFVCTFIAQLLQVSDVRLDRFSDLMVIIYITLLAAIAGFIIIYKGTANLEKLETASTSK